MTDKILTIVKKIKSGNPNMAYKEIKTFKEGFKAHTNLCKGKDG